MIGPDTTLVDCEVGQGATVPEEPPSGREHRCACHRRPVHLLAAGHSPGFEQQGGRLRRDQEHRGGRRCQSPHPVIRGDAQIGEGSNIGAATVFVNYDGVAKHRTVVGKHARIGSDSMLVAPLTIGDGAYTAAGSVITADVGPGDLAVVAPGSATLRAGLWPTVRKRLRLGPPPRMTRTDTTAGANPGLPDR